MAAYYFFRTPAIRCGNFFHKKFWTLYFHCADYSTAEITFILRIFLLVFLFSKIFLQASLFDDFATWYGKKKFREMRKKRSEDFPSLDSRVDFFIYTSLWIPNPHRLRERVAMKGVGRGV